MPIDCASRRASKVKGKKKKLQPERKRRGKEWRRREEGRRGGEEEGGKVMWYNVIGLYLLKTKNYIKVFGSDKPN